MDHPIVCQTWNFKSYEHDETFGRAFMALTYDSWLRHGRAKGCLFEKASRSDELNDKFNRQAYRLWCKAQRSEELGYTPMKVEDLESEPKKTCFPVWSRTGRYGG